MHTRLLFVPLVALLALPHGLIACGGDSEGPSGTVTGSLEATGGELADPALFTVTSATLGADGWVAVWHEFGSSHSLAGAVYLTAGSHTNVAVPLDPPVGTLSATGGLKLRVSLHIDAPADRAFTATETRIDGDDPVVLNADGVPVAGVLEVSLPPQEPNQLLIADQTITLNPPKVTVAATLETAPAYVVLTNAAGDVLGSERIWDKNPRSYPVSVDLQRSWDAVPLTGALYAADGNAPDMDTPILNLAGAPVRTTFNVTFPPENVLDARDQTLNSWGYKIAIAEVDVDELPAIVAVHADDDGALGEVLGAFAVTTSPKVLFSVDLKRFVDPTETLWVAVYADAAPLGEVTAADTLLLGTDAQPLRVAITVTNASCDGLKTKYCDPNTPHDIRWLDRCDAPSSVSYPCGDDALCDDTGPYVACKPIPDPCAGIAGTICVDEDPTATWFEDNCGVPLRVSARCGATSICEEGPSSATCKLAPSCAGNAETFCDPTDPRKIFWRDHCGEPNGNFFACGSTSICDDTDGTPGCALAPSCAGNVRLACNPADLTKLYWVDRCGQLTDSTLPCGATSECVETAGSATCTLAPTCEGNATTVCDATDPGKVFWLDRCGERNGNFFACGATSVCDDSDGTPGCALAPSCAGNVSLACNSDDPENLYWIDRCGELSGATLPCGAGLVCDDTSGEANCIDPNPCVGPAHKICDPDDLSVIKWRGPCGDLLASTIPCGANSACSDADGEPRCVSTDVCGGNASTVCLDDDPGHVYWVDQCGALTGSTYPCGVATCDDSGEEARCTFLASCEDQKRRVCDPEDPTTVLLTNACGDDLGVFSTCANGKQCVEATAGDARCDCVPSDEVRCFGHGNLYQPSGIRRVDSCGNWSGETVTECANGEICENTEAGPTCATSLTNRDSPMYHRGCSFPDYVRYKTDLDVDCRCRRHPGTLGDIDRYDYGGNLACSPQTDSFAEGWTMAAGPHFRHMLHSFNGGGVYSAATNELYATKHFTDPTYEGAGMVVAYNITTGARRIVSGRFPEEGGAYTMYGSGFESQRAVGVLRHEMTTLPGAWDLEQAANGDLYVWGSRSGNKEITRVNPTTGARTLVWKQALEADIPVAPTHGQCYSTRAKSTFHGGFIPVQLESHAFAMGPDGSFYLGFRNDGAEGNGIVRISANGATCTVISRWNGTMGDVGGGANPQYSNLEGFLVRNGKLYATLQIGKVLLSIDIVTGDRTAIANPPGSVHSTTGQSTMFWDESRDLLITAGGVQSYLAVAVDVTTGLRQALFLVAPDMPIKSAPPRETGAHGAIDNANYMGYGALAMDPHDNDHIYMVIKWGLLKYEMSTGNSYVMSQ